MEGGSTGFDIGGKGKVFEFLFCQTQELSDE